MKVITNSAAAKTSKDFERQQFGVANMSIIMELLTKLYSNPKQTLTQEYICNARDAIREAKSNNAIEITAPTRVNPILKIRDYGVGLSPERISKVFLLYGASTKRNSNSQTGGFGIGAKSAWSYTDSFTIVTFVDGIKRSYVAHKSNGNGNLDLLEEIETTEANGTEVQIAVKHHDIDAFSEAILRTIHFWNDNEKPNVKGITSVYPETKLYKVNDNFTLIQSMPEYINGSKFIAVIDGIPYNIEYDMYNGNRDLDGLCRWSGIFTLNNGDLKVAPTRENLINDDFNKKVIKSLFDKAFKDLNAIVKKEVDGATELSDKVKVANTFCSMLTMNFNLGDYVLSGSRLEPKFIGNGPDANNYNYRNCFTKYYIYNSYRRRSSGGTGEVLKKNEDYRIDADQLSRVFYVDDLTESLAKRGFRIRKVADNGQTVVMINHPNDTIKLKLIKDLCAQPLSSIDASDYKIFREKKDITKKEFCAHYYSGYNLSATQVKAEDFKDITLYDWMDSSTYDNRKNLSDLWSYLDKINLKFCFISKGSEKHVKSNPNLVLLSDFVATHVPKDEVIKNYIGAKLEKLGFLLQVKAVVKDLTNTDIVKVVNILSEKDYRNGTLPAMLESVLANTKIYKEFEAIVKDVNSFEKGLKDNYPLVFTFSSDNIRYNKAYKQHVIEYLNK